MEFCIADYMETVAKVVSTACAFRTMAKAVVNGVSVAELIERSRAIQERLLESSI